MAVRNIRSFVAVESSPEVQQAAARLIEQLQPLTSDVKWVESHNMHLTLQFLGEVPEGKIPAIIEALRKVAVQCTPFQLEIRGIGAFPSIRRPNVLWLGVGEGGTELAALAQKVQRALQALGVQLDQRPFHGHLTLGRVRRGGPGLEKLIARFEQQEDFVAGWIYVQNITLFSSQLTPHGPIYRPLEHFPLRHC
ncbi:MAG: RNA 2',3'-cyclic phosphodiesterase [Thermoguttaceae bacterium]|nr:RNA 2',3'-cyclic phosphodiesterase [Thermoguttaceae bacterium]MDW8036503.1 RNA 2',3'-cyclic phosphodiesterase [Thermoguttaceae bacterium]